MAKAYSSHPQVNLLTALLLAHNITEVVVCPGSRNAILTHNFHQAEAFNLHAITDERSATFAAIGIWLKTRRPVVLCVTSGSALLNTLPGVAEAHYRHIPLIIISADRPTEWIGQLDGQTLPQVDALRPYAHTWNLPELRPDDNTWYCERLINEALNEAQKYSYGGEVVHLNVPLSEPLFNYTTTELPSVRCIHCPKASSTVIPQEILSLLHEAQFPLLIIGQCELPTYELNFLHKMVERGQLFVFAENISNFGDNRLALFLEENPTTPDLILHIGGALVNKRFKQYLRSTTCPVIRIAEDDSMPDTFCNLRYKLTADPIALLHQLSDLLPSKPSLPAFDFPKRDANYLFLAMDCEAIFVGNSSSVRWVNRLLPQVGSVPIYCNRGTNGIEGSLSVAAGYALRQTQEGKGLKILCIIGDLSFFYDVNALWNSALHANLRILLVNNQGGAIFQHIPGLNQSPVLEQYVMAQHHSTAEGIARSFNCHYFSAQITDFDSEIEEHLYRLLEINPYKTPNICGENLNRPIIYEVFTQQTPL